MEKEGRQGGKLRLFRTCIMYDNEDLNKIIQERTGKVDPNKEDSEYIFRLYFHTVTFRVAILIQEGYELDFTEGGFAVLLGYDKKVLGAANNRGDHVLDITREASTGSTSTVALYCLHFLPH